MAHAAFLRSGARRRSASASSDACSRASTVSAADSFAGSRWPLLSKVSIFALLPLCENVRPDVRTSTWSWNVSTTYGKTDSSWSACSASISKDAILVCRARSAEMAATTSASWPSTTSQRSLAPRMGKAVCTLKKTSGRPRSGMGRFCRSAGRPGGLSTFNKPSEDRRFSSGDGFGCRAGVAASSAMASSARPRRGVSESGGSPGPRSSRRFVRRSFAVFGDSVAGLTGPLASFFWGGKKISFSTATSLCGWPSRASRSCRFVRSRALPPKGAGAGATTRTGSGAIVVPT
mmetsp:Transcript_21727/g.73646  ORF Transcript_21727/g.73646 Transcript_21727/m.73646 type:complete len:290 (-) Transcript_21727:1419-2288(-)